ncbi:MAG: CoA transferase [Dehalococcoidia bacterium]|nr:CoA transferase [Dehalococcoidia bacterium]
MASGAPELSADARLPLAGVRVLDLTMVWAGPVGTRFLADMGAEVIKVECARAWDQLRSLHFLGGDTERWWDKSAYFNHNNRNKYACTLNLKTARGRELALRLVAGSDLVFENYRADVIGTFGLDYDDLRAVKPDIILVSMPSHGKSGPEADHVAYGTNVEQLSGLASLSGYPGLGPHKSAIAYGDPNAGTLAAAAALAALHHRRRTGEGQHIEVAQWEAMIPNIGEFVLGYGMTGGQPESIANRHISRAQGVYACAPEGDAADAWVAVSVGSDDAFAALCRTIGRPELARDERFADVVSRHHHHDALDEIIGAWTAGRTHRDAAAALQAAGVAAAPVLRIPELMADEHLQARGFWESVTHAIAGTWEMEGVVWRLGRTPGHVRVPPPCYAEHNGWVLHDLLGLDDAAVAALERDGIISSAPDLRIHA